MKKFITPIVCLALIICSLAINLSPTSDVKLGKGSGTNAKIANTTEFSDLLYFISNHNYNVDDKELFANSISPLSTNTFADQTTEQKDENKPTNLYESVTMYDKTTLKSYSKVHRNINGNSSTTETNTKLSRSMTLYMTKDSAYYSSLGTLSTIVKYGDYYNSSNAESEKYRVEFDIEMYLTKSKVLVKFNKFDIIGNQEDMSTPFDSVFNKWILFDEEFAAQDIMGVDVMNREVLSRLNDYLIENKKTSFINEGSLYTVKNDFAIEALSFIVGTSLPKETNCGLKIDLSKPTNPTTIFNFDYTYSDSDSISNDFTGYYESYSVNSSATSYEELRFTNINNTVCELNEDIETISFKDIMNEFEE